MKWRPALKRFGLRFAISLVILGGLYLLLFGTPWTSHNSQPRTVTEKIAALRAALNQTYLIGNSLANFKQSDAAASYTLGQINSQFESTSSDLELHLKRAPTEVSSATRQQIQTILNRQKQALTDYKARFNVLSQVIAYDPESDLGSLSSDRDIDKLQIRALAAKKGLTKAANNTGRAANSSQLDVTSADQSSIIPADLKEALLSQADCFGRIGRQSTEVSQLRANCIQSYPSLRLQAIAATIQPAFGGAYGEYMNTVVSPLLRQLDELIK